MTISLALKPVAKPTLYEIHKAFDNVVVGTQKGIKGEHETRMVIFTSFVLGKNCVIIEGSRGAGKTAVMTVVSSFCPNPMVVDKASDKAHIRNEALNESTHIIIPEINKVANSFIEALKDMGEGKATSYTVMDEFKRARTFTIDPKPFITSKADENNAELGEELVSRLITVKTNSSSEMNKEIVNYKFLKAQNPFEKSEVTTHDISVLQDYVKMLPDIGSIIFIYTPGVAMSKAIPSLFTDSRRDTDKYLNNTYGITMFHYYDRIKTVIEGQTILFVTPEDVWLNHIIIGKAIVRSALKCSEIEEKIIQILRAYKTNNLHNPRMFVKDLHQTLHDNGFNPNVKTVTKYCKQLYNNGYIIENDDTKPTTYEPLADDKSYDFNIDWADVVEECGNFMKDNYPELANEYIERFCTNPTTTHPFTGKKVEILNWEAKGEKLKIKRTKTLFDVTEPNPKELVIKSIEKGDNEAIKLEEEFGEKLLQTMVKEGDIYEEPIGSYKIL